MPNIDEAIDALLAYQQADMDGVMVLTSRQAIHEVTDELKRLRAVPAQGKPTKEDFVRLQHDAGIPNPPTPLTYWYRLAMDGEGPHAYNWSDKPHRLVYDLCSEIERLAAPLAEGQPVRRCKCGYRLVDRCHACGDVEDASRRFPAAEAHAQRAGRNEALAEIVSHYDVWKQALEASRDHANRCHERDDALYWEHEIRALERVFAVASQSPAASGIMATAGKAAETVAGWSPSKREYAARVVGGSPAENGEVSSFRSSLIEACARFADDLVTQTGRTQEWHDAARGIPGEIRALARCSQPECASEQELHDFIILHDFIMDDARGSLARAILSKFNVSRK